MNYEVIINRRLIKLNTLSPNKLFYYRIKKAVQLNKSAFGCPISFYDINKKIIYHKKNSFAHELHSDKERSYYSRVMDSNIENSSIVEPVIKLVNWSKQGNWCYFLEYFGGGFVQKYQNIFLNFKGRCSYRIDDLVDDSQFVNDNEVIDNPFDEDIILEKLKQKNIPCNYLEPDEIKDGFLNNFLRSKWYP